MVILSQDKTTLWNVGSIIDFQLDIMSEYQQEKRVTAENGENSVYVDYYPSVGKIKANCFLGNQAVEISLFTSSANDARKVFEDLAKAFKNGENYFEIPKIKSGALDPVSICRFVKDKEQKRYIQLKKWIKYEKSHPLTDLRIQLVKVYIDE